MFHITVHLKSGAKKSDFKKTYHAHEWLSVIRSKEDGLVTIKINQDSIHNFKNIANAMSWINLHQMD